MRQHLPIPTSTCDNILIYTNQMQRYEKKLFIRGYIVKKQSV